MSSQELALYIHALLVACVDPRDFYGHDLVQELRKSVETGGSYSNPFLILVLCNAGDAMTVRDVERVTFAYDSQHRPFWTEDEIVQNLMDVHGETITVRFSVWMGGQVNQARSWRVKMCLNSTIYHVIETVDKVVNKRKVEYDVVYGKPFLTAWNGKQDDPEMGTFWFVYLKT
ncbi:unnamed protein product, partial [Larinioides sclopetarius]